MKNILGTNNPTLIEADTLKSTNAHFNTRAVISASTGTTYSAADLLRGHIRRTGFNTSITDTFPSATSLINLIPDAAIGDNFLFTINIVPTTWNINGAGTNGVIWTFNAGAGGNNRGNLNSFTFSGSNPGFAYIGRIIITNVTTPAYDILRFANVGSTA